MRNIIHITGASGAGKTTIGQYFAKKQFFVIDTDVVDDKNALDMLRTDNKVNYKKLKQIDTKEFAKILNGTTANIIIVGRIIKMKHVLKLVKDEYKFYGFYLNVDAETIFRRVNLRHLRLIQKHGNELTKLFESDESINKITDLALFKFELRRPFINHIDDIKNNILKDKLKAKKDKYKIATAENIIASVERLK